MSRSPVPPGHTPNSRASGWMTLMLLSSVGGFLASAGVLEAQVKPTELSGTVVTRDGPPLSNARVVVVGTTFQTITGRDGRFELRSLPAGSHVVEVSFIGHQTQQFTVEMAPGAAREIEIRMEVAALALDPVEVTGRSSMSAEMQGFHQRRERGTGYYFTGEEIAEMRARALTDVLRRIPGAEVQNLPGGYGGRQALQMGRATGIAGTRACEVVFFVNGQCFPISTDVGINGFVRPDEIDGLEVYSGSSRIPPQFSAAPNARCGVIVIWTRNGPPAG